MSNCLHFGFSGLNSSNVYRQKFLELLLVYLRRLCLFVCFVFWRPIVLGMRNLRLSYFLKFFLSKKPTVGRVAANIHMSYIYCVHFRAPLDKFPR